MQRIYEHFTLIDMMRKDSFGQIINGRKTYKTIAIRLRVESTCAIPWADSEGARLDIVFSLPSIEGTMQRGIREGDLFVSIVGFGTFAFEISESNLNPDYIGEKLNLIGIESASTSIKLGRLVNKVRQTLHTMR